MSRKKLYEKILKEALFIVNEEKHCFKTLVECVEFVSKCYIDELKVFPGESKEAWSLNIQHDLLDLALEQK